MQVEVSKHTEGSKEKTTRPNGLPESLIRYDGTAHILPILFILFWSFALFIRAHDSLKNWRVAGLCFL